MAIFGKRVFADVAGDLEMKKSVGLLSRWTLNTETIVLIRYTQRSVTQAEEEKAA